MKICPICEKEYQDDMNFCLEDGSVLTDKLEFQREKTLLIQDGQVTLVQQRARNSAPSPDLTTRQTEIFPAPRRFKPFWLIALICSALLAGGLIYGVANRLYAGYSAGKADVNDNNSGFGTAKPQNDTKPPKSAELKIEVVEKQTGRFGQQFLKCLVTNTGNAIVVEPRVEITLYRNDIKLGDVRESPEIRYLKPNQSVPVWISLGDKEKNYTLARVNENVEQRVLMNESDLLFPSFVFSDLKMKDEMLTSLINFRPVRENYKVITGVVENNQYEKIAAQLYFVFYDGKDEIVGFATTYPPELKKGEKAEFRVIKNENEIFGKADRFEIVAVNKNHWEFK